MIESIKLHALSRALTNRNSFAININHIEYYEHEDAECAKVTAEQR